AFSAALYTANESTGGIDFIVTRVGGGGSVTVHVATGDGTGSAGIDYVPVSQDLTFGPNVSSESFPIVFLRDPQATGSRTVQLLLSNPGGGAALGSPASA